MDEEKDVIVSSQNDQLGEHVDEESLKELAIKVEDHELGEY